MFDSCEENKTSIRDLEDIEAFFEKVTGDHETFLHTIGVQPGLIDHEVCRATLFEDVLKIYERQVSTLDVTVSISYKIPQ